MTRQRSHIRAARAALALLASLLVLSDGFAFAQEPAAVNAAAPAAPVPAPAPEPAKDAVTLTATGSFVSRYEWRDGVFGSTFADSDAVRTRARLGLHTTKIDVADHTSFKAHFVPQAGGFWNVGGDSLTDATLGLHEGFVDVHFGDHARLDIGRFEMSYGEELVIGAVGWHHLGRAFDGARLHLTHGSTGITLDAFCTTLAEGLLDGAGDDLMAGDLYFTGLYLGLGPVLDNKMQLDVYVLSRIWGEVADVTNPADSTVVLGDEAAAELTAGLRAKGKAGDFVYRLEGGGQFGARPSTDPATRDSVGVLAYQADLEVGLDLEESAHLRATLEGFIASGDDASTEEDEGWNQLFPTAHKWLGLMDAMGGRTNIYGGVLHLVGAFKPFTVKLDTHTFFRPRVAADAESYQGTEVDLNVIYGLGKGAKLRALYGQFIPEAADSFDDHLHFVELEFGLVF